MHLFTADLRSIWRCIEFSKPGLLAGPAGATWTVEWSPAFPGPEPPVIDPGFFHLLLLFRSLSIHGSGTLLLLRDGSALEAHWGLLFAGIGKYARPCHAATTRRWTDRQKDSTLGLFQLPACRSLEHPRASGASGDEQQGRGLLVWMNYSTRNE